MSRTIKSTEPPGKDWWSRRPNSGERFSSKHGSRAWWKRNTHKRERQQAKHPAEACSTTSPQHPPTIRESAVESLIVHPSHAESMDGSSAL